MIVGVGVDLCAIGRIERIWQQFAWKFARRILHPEELRSLESCRTHPQRMQTLAGMFAAKEAVAKALGTGLAQGVGWSMIQVIRRSNRGPEICLHARARQNLARRLEALGGTREGRIWLSLSHDGGLACAFVVIERRAPAETRD